MGPINMNVSCLAVVLKLDLDCSLRTLIELHTGNFDHLHRCSVFKQTVPLQNEAIGLPILASVHGDVNGFLKLFKFELVASLL